MPEQKAIVIIGLEPSLIDFYHPDYAGFPGLSADKILGGLKADQKQLQDLGYRVDLCLTDFGQTAEQTVTTSLAQCRYDCVLIGAGVRTVPSNFLLFEKLVNLVHAHAPQAKICFNTKPSDSAAAIQRWI